MLGIGATVRNATSLQPTAAQYAAMQTTLGRHQLSNRAVPGLWNSSCPYVYRPSARTGITVHASEAPSESGLLVRQQAVKCDREHKRVALLSSPRNHRDLSCLLFAFANSGGRSTLCNMYDMSPHAHVGCARSRPSRRIGHGVKILLRHGSTGILTVYGSSLLLVASTARV